MNSIPYICGFGFLLAVPATMICFLADPLAFFIVPTLLLAMSYLSFHEVN